MGSYIKWILLLAVLNVLMFYGYKFGISASIFMIPLLILIYVFLKKNNKINNKKGLLLMIPILLLSISYGIFDSNVFDVFNCIVIIILFELLYIFTIKPVDKLNVLIEEVFSLLVMPITYIGNFYRVSVSKISSKIKISPKTKKVLLSCLIVLPVVLVVVLLLSSADLIFGNLFDNIFGNIFDVLEEFIFNNFLGRLLRFVIIFFIIGISLMYVLFEYPKKKDIIISENKKTRDVFTIKLLVSVLNIIYIVFDIIQIKSLMLHSVSSNINYAEYARQGFFELLIVSIINIAIILISKKFETKDNEKDYKFINIMNILMIFLTMIIIISSFLRMNLYESAYGYTTLRLLVYIALITETILMIPTAMYIFNSNVNILKCYMIIIICSYVLTNYINIDYMVARRNVNRYYINNKIDMEYLINFGYDNIPVLYELYNKTDDVNIKEGLREYFKSMTNNENDSIFEFNISKYKAMKLLKEEFK